DALRGVVRERCIGDGAHAIGTRRSECIETTDGRIAKDDCIDGATHAVSALARGGQRLGCTLPKRAVTLFENGKNVRHDQSTFASEVSASMSAGTAAAPSPTIRPAGRSGGNANDATVTCAAPVVTGTTSSGFFFAAMIPLRPGKRGVLSPLSQVSSAG